MSDDPIYEIVLNDSQIQQSCDALKERIEGYPIDDDTVLVRLLRSYHLAIAALRERVDMLELQRETQVSDEPHKTC